MSRKNPQNMLLNKQKSNQNSVIESIFWYFFPENFRLFWFVSRQFCFGCFASIPKQRVLMFRLNRNSLIESIFCCFSENLRFFRFVLKQFCMFPLFWYRFQTLKQTETNQQVLFLVCETNRNTTKTDLVSVQTDFFSFRGHPTWTIFFKNRFP